MRTSRIATSSLSTNPRSPTSRCTHTRTLHRMPGSIWMPTPRFAAGRAASRGCRASSTTMSGIPTTRVRGRDGRSTTPDEQGPALCGHAVHHARRVLCAGLEAGGERRDETGGADRQIEDERGRVTCEPDDERQYDQCDGDSDVGVAV